MNNLFDNIRAEISRKRWSIEDFCQELGIQRTMFYRWEDKGDLPVSQLIRISQVLSVSTDYLLGLGRDIASTEQ
ncbi:MAG: helix-turn-helix transcriptional regulator [Oscillospiraceae bacterium]|nr:helix-turn-helix transcriptional regulator [Oscillospiraceae bacterium]